MPFDNNQREQLKKRFNELDKDHSGKLEKDEIRDVVKKTNPNVSDQEIDDLIKQADKNGDGLIDFEEFLTLVEQNKI